MLNRKLR